MHRLAILSSHIFPKNEDQIAPSSCSHTLKSASSSDYFKLDELLSNEEIELRYKMRSLMETKVKPIINPYIEKAEFPNILRELLCDTHRAGGFIKGYGCPGSSIIAVCMAVMEIAKVDGSCATFYMVHGLISMLAIGLCGSEKQKSTYLPKMATYEHIGSFALTEPNRGSDATNLETTAKKVEGGWIINGKKRWIGNATLAHVIIVWAKDADSSNMYGFIVEKDTPGMKISKIENKMSLRCVQNADIELNNVFVREENRLPLATNFKNGPGRVLFVSRVFSAWLSIGLAMGAYEIALEYSKKREQFGTPISHFQISQQKLFEMLSIIQSMTYLAFRASQHLQKNTLTEGMGSMTKAFCTKQARKVVALAREMIGGNGIVYDYGVASKFVDIEGVYTYEGTYDINALVTGREITGVAAIKIKK